MDHPPSPAAAPGPGSASDKSALDYLKHNGSVLTNIRETKVFDEDTAAALSGQIDDFKKGFQTSDGKLLAGREEHTAADADDVEQEQIVKQKR